MRAIIMAALLISNAAAAQHNLSLALVKYNGGGDWYANLETSLPNLAKFCNEQLDTDLSPDQEIVTLDDPRLYQFPFLHLTGHGNVIFSDAEIGNLRKYLIAGGFLHIDDNYGLDRFIRIQMKRVFPELDFIELPPSHPIFHQTYEFPSGLPKIHEHDNKRPQAFGLFYEGRLVCLYTYECDLGDGWEDPRIHNDPPEAHLKALQMGANIIQYVFTNHGSKAEHR
ncbi:MAG: DUF4159 domain-containing protein [Salibacteraceae bacterium]